VSENEHDFKLSINLMSGKWCKRSCELVFFSGNLLLNLLLDMCSIDSRWYLQGFEH